MKKIYGNDNIRSTLISMVKSGRTAHSLLFYGEKGSGKKLMADLYTKLLLCESPTDEGPCGKCRSCRNSDSGIHPDVTYVEHSGKLGGFSVETARAVISDAYIKPNNSSGRKIYIFADCHNMDQRTQNTLLKLIEEPPDYAFFIFTAESKAEFLPTIISRCVCLGTSVCSSEEAEKALSESGFSPEEAKKAVSCFHGNIGMCTSYLIDENLRKQVDLTKSLADSIIRKDEYALNVSLFSVGKERGDIKAVLSMLDKLIRDCAVLSKCKDAETISCFREGAERLSSMLTASQSIKIHRCIERAWSAVESNVSAPLVLTSLCAEIAGIVR
ncbi:MAG: DNA polymerase III subunit delta' [Ruminococcus sp.]|nr:DNA polymerase III subunit delta' [Ruminococcus sp.]